MARHRDLEPENDDENASPTLLKIEQGAYRVAKLAELPPALPVLMRKPTADLDDDELEEMLAQRKEFRAEQKAYQAKVADRDAMVELMLDQLQGDLRAEFGLEDTTKAAQLFKICHSYAKGDLTRLYGFYDDLHVLLKNEENESA